MKSKSKPQGVSCAEWSSQFSEKAMLTRAGTLLLGWGQSTCAVVQNLPVVWQATHPNSLDSPLVSLLVKRWDWMHTSSVSLDFQQSLFCRARGRGQGWTFSRKKVQACIRFTSCGTVHWYWNKKYKQSHLTCSLVLKVCSSFLWVSSYQCWIQAGLYKCDDCGQNRQGQMALLSSFLRSCTGLSHFIHCCCC